MLNLKLIEKAYHDCKHVFNKTPLIKNDKLFNFTLYNKLENLQITGSFKVRGAYNKILNLSEQEKEVGVICASAGNHAQGVALAASQLGIRATIIMPKIAPLAKIEATKSYGVEVILYGDNFDEAYNFAKQLQIEQSKTFIEPYDDYLVMAGQGTIGLEILEELDEIDYIFVPIGGGGLASGLSCLIKSLKPTTKIVGVQACKASSMFESINHNKIIATKKSDTIADGIAVKKVGDLTFSECQKYLDEIVLVNEKEINHAILFALEKLNLTVEGAGSVGLAAILANKIDIKKDQKVVNIISGGNIDITLISTLIDTGLRNDYRRITFGTILSDKPGALSKLLELLSNQQANIIGVVHDRYHHNPSAKTCYVEVTIDTFHQQHINDIFELLSHNNYDYRIK